MSRFPFVLMYHSVGEIVDDPHRLTVTPDRLGAQLAALRAQGLRGLSVRDLRAAGGRGVGLTFDDGYADFLHAAVPVLREHGCTATVFALPGRLGGDNGWDAEGERKRLMTADELRAAADAGMEVASHGLRHVRLTELTREALAEEVGGSRRALEAIVDGPVEGFAYP
ncbi:MAG: polysaccharide deacetylase family protein, partial [Pseudonocardia sp.]|nr:polysaccharide deacetylase family protein [Pseudonocardia sp.]